MTTPRPTARHFLLVLVIALCAAAPAFAETPVPPDHAEKMVRGQEIFTKSIRPLLMERCLRCHGGEKTRSGLDITTREGLLKGGDKGLVVAPYQSKESRLYRFVSHLDEPFMPPKEDRLSAEAVAQIAAWIDDGAPYDKPLLDKAVVKKPKQVTDEDRKFWSFLPSPTSARAGGEGRRRGVAADADRLASSWRSWKKKAWRRTAAADRRTLIRRAYFDLIGLPPTPDEVEAFVNDARPDAYDKLDRPPARQPALRRALGAALARPGPLRREPRLRARLRPAHRLPLPRLRHQGAQPGPALRHVRASGRSPATSSRRTIRWR